MDASCVNAGTNDTTIATTSTIAPTPTAMRSSRRSCSARRARAIHHHNGTINTSNKPMVDHQRIQVELETVVLIKAREIAHRLTQRDGARIATRGEVDVLRRPERSLCREAWSSCAPLRT